MRSEDFLISVLYALPFFALAGVYLAVASRKKRRGLGLRERALALASAGERERARELLREALWNANEEPELERGILRDLHRLSAEDGLSFESDDYEALVRQYEQLSKKGSYKALGELKQVQALKRKLIDRMSGAA